MTRDDDALALLREIRDRQAEALALQREQFKMYKRQFDRAERLQDRAETLQVRHAKAIGFARLTLWIAVPALVLMIGLSFWPYLVNLWP